MARIREMKARGLTNNQIIEMLQKQGMTSAQIFDLLTQDDAPDDGPQMAPPRAPPMQPQYVQPHAPSFGTDTEELIEAIIDEKWNDLMNDINKVIAWKDATESRITRMDQQLTDLRDQFEKLHQAVVGKVGEYDQHILDVGAEVKAMEKVFSKVLPVFTDNVAELSRVAERIGKAAPKK